MTPEEYIQSRVDEQIGWYSKKSRSNQNWFKTIKMIELVSASVIPFVAGMGKDISLSPWILGFLGVAVAICAGATTLYHHHENWITYRTTSEMLKHEKYLFVTSSGPYAEKEQFDVFVQRVESLLSKENLNWAANSQKPKNKNNKVAGSKP